MARRPALTTLALAVLTAGAIVVAVLVVGSPAASSAQARTVTAERGVIQSTVSGSGNLEPANQADVDFATSGEITHIYVKEGQHVSKDDILAKVDPSAANVDLAQAEADSAQLSVESAEKAVAATTLRAPMAGTVTAVNGAVGQTVSGGSTSSSSSSSSSTGSGGAS